MDIREHQPDKEMTEEEIEKIKAERDKEGY